MNSIKEISFKQSLRRILRAIEKYGLLGFLRRWVHMIVYNLSAIVNNLSAIASDDIRKTIEDTVVDQERLRVREAIDNYFDRVYRVDTRGTVIKNDFGISGGNVDYSKSYQAVLPQPFVETMEQFPIDFRKFIFVDFGSGKGRAVLLASEFPFKKIIGVELVPQFHRIAEANCRGYKSTMQHCREIELLCMDATDFSIPLEPLVLHFYNPFGIEVMSKIAAQIVQSLKEHPREIYIVYFSPKVRGVFENIDALELFPIRQPTLPGWPVAVWRSRA